MSIHYLVNPFTTNGDITDVVTADAGQTEATGATIIRVPDGVAIHNTPTNRSTLITSKYAGLLAYYAGFTDILADPCLDGLTIDPALTLGVLISSGLVNHSFLAAPGGTGFISTMFPLGFAPTQCVVVWEEYSFSDNNDKTSRLKRTYVEESGNNLVARVTFNNGALYSVPVTNGSVFNIPVLAQGLQFRISLYNPTASRIYLGSWALIY